ncbi:MAG: diaminopimelate decarboxylase [Lachnospiraceae bacterium]|nr:diaminopimelate decarboxylase [Lachnospiraceae bacterium]
MSEIREIKNGRLYFDGCDTTELVKQYGSPIYVMSYTAIMDRVNELKRDFLDKYPGSRVAYASKAFCTVGMYEILKKNGICIDIVSGGELYVAKKAGFPAEMIEFNGNNKLPSEIDDAVSYGVGRFILDGINEAELIDEACKKYGKKAKIMVRITPGVAASTHDYIITGKKDSKFGIPLEEETFFGVMDKIMKYDTLEFEGLHMHIGSQLFEYDAYIKSLDALMDWVKKIYEKYGVATKEVNFGGGFGATYINEERKPYSFFLEPLMKRLKERADEIGIPVPLASIEPGRSMVCEAGLTLYTVGQMKEIKGIREYLAIDGGMYENMRVALYQAEYDGLIANKADEPKTRKVSVTGKCCESGDILINDLMVCDSVERGDILAIFSTGAYGYSMASNYNNNPVPGVVLVKEGQSEWLVKPETYEQIAQNQVHCTLI